MRRGCWMEVGCCVAPLTHVSVLSSAEATLEQLSLSQSLVHVYAARRGREAVAHACFLWSPWARGRGMSMRSVGLPSTCTCIFKVGVQSRCSKTAGAKNSWQERICTFCGITPGRLGVVQAGRWHGPSTILGIFLAPCLAPPVPVPYFRRAGVSLLAGRRRRRRPHIA